MDETQLRPQVKTDALTITHYERSALERKRHWVLWDPMVGPLPRLEDQGRFQVIPDLDLKNEWSWPARRGCGHSRPRDEYEQRSSLGWLEYSQCTHRR